MMLIYNILASKIRRDTFSKRSLKDPLTDIPAVMNIYTKKDDKDPNVTEKVTIQMDSSNKEINVLSKNQLIPKKINLKNFDFGFEGNLKETPTEEKPSILTIKLKRKTGSQVKDDVVGDKIIFEITTLNDIKFIFDPIDPSKIIYPPEKKRAKYSYDNIIFILYYFYFFITIYSNKGSLYLI